VAESLVVSETREHTSPKGPPLRFASAPRKRGGPSIQGGYRRAVAEMVRVNDFVSDIVAISFLLAAPAARAE
jgi:hypothetical protein